MNLVIVESPTKAKTITRFLGGDFVVKSSYGHVRDLPQKELGVDTENDFEPKYVIPLKAKKNVAELKRLAVKSDQIILATDEDREGEAIAWHLVEALGLTKKKTAKPTQRIVFHEITKNAIESALKKPRIIDQGLVDAQQARRVLDRLVGYKLSPFLWKKVARGLSAGRVQSVAVRLIVEREREIEKFKSEEYWSLKAAFQKTGIEAFLAKINEETLDKLGIKSQVEAEKIIKDLEGAEFKVASLDKKELIRKPLGPFTTSTLQQDAARKLGFSAKQTMMLAQQLYEGIELGEDGSVGLITYMRTDSVNLSEESLVKAKGLIISMFGENYLEQRRFKTKSKSAQEAHEAVRPTEPERLPESVRSHLTPQQFKLYNLIWKRFMASQMKTAIFDSTAIDITAKQYTFRANGSVLKFDGFLKIYPMKFEEAILPVLEAGKIMEQPELLPEQHFTKPPARFNEASLVKMLEKEGIGRPSTYAPIISTIQDRNYVNKDVSKYFHPTEIGIMVNDVLVEHFPKIVDPKFTSKMEEDLDEIEFGRAKWIPVIKDFYVPFAELLKEKYQEVSKAEVTQQEKTGEKCEKCGGDMMVRMGRYGKFVACSNFPKCKNILKTKKDKAEPEKTGEKCEKCGGDMVIRVSRFGKFMACANYPKCKNTKKIIAPAETPAEVSPKTPE
jgi:DNA topoisomerase-1